MCTLHSLCMCQFRTPTRCSTAITYIHYTSPASCSLAQHGAKVFVDCVLGGDARVAIPLNLLHVGFIPTLKEPIMSLSGSECYV